MSTENEHGDDLHILSSLLVKERSDELSEQVKIILASELKLKEKIKKISDLDREEEQKAAAQENRKPPSEETVKPVKNDKKADVQNEESEEKAESQGYLSKPKRKAVPQKPASDYVIDTLSSEAAIEIKNNRHKLAQNRKSLKPLIQRTSFFRFFFMERRQIRLFSENTGVIRTRTFGTRLVLNPMVLGALSKNIRKVAEELLKPLTTVLDHGWFYLDKRDYNLIVILYKLCLDITRTDFKGLNPKSIHLIDKIPAIEHLFLILKYEPSDVRQLIYAVDIVFSKDPKKIEIEKNATVNIHKLLDNDSMRPSLHNIILGMNMLKTKKNLELEDLMNPSLKLIDIHDFNCSPKIRDKINDNLRKLENGIKPLLEQEKETFRLHAFIPTDESGEVDLSLLKTFYDTYYSSKRQSYDFNKENIIKFILNLGYAFHKSFRDFLSEKIILESENIRSLFAQPIFGQDLIRIELNLEKLDKIQTILPKFPTSRCLAIKKSTSGAIESEANAIQIIYEIAGTMVSMGKRIAHILRYSIPPGEEEGHEPVEIQYFSYAEQSYQIPFEAHKLKMEGYLNGMIVRDALYQITSICYQTGVFVQHGELTELLKKEKKIRDEIRLRTKHYKRLAHEKIYLAFMEKYDLPF